MTSAPARVTALFALTTDVSRASLAFTVLAIAAGATTIAIAAIALVGLFGGGAARVRRSALDRLGGVALWGAFVVAAVCTGGSLWFSEVGGLTPCKLCWFQRICMYPLAPLLGVAALRRDRLVAFYALPLAVVGMGVSTYHYLVEWFPSLESGSGCDPLNPCTVVWFRRLGFVSLPFMALVGFATVSALVLVAVTRAGGGAHSAVRPSPVESS